MLSGIVRGAAGKDGGGKNIGMTVHTDDPAPGRWLRREIGFNRSASETIAGGLLFDR
jgi:hypothetical protein